jgi:2-dehydro-3-deoxyphosphogluconate aldolase/(4S)-4-hydroxy-2-oxoglutarate aldolase
MRSREKIIEALIQRVLIAVIRTKDARLVLPVCEALVKGGITALEITMTVPRALEVFREVKDRLGGEAVMGVGSVLNAAMSRAAMEAGAEFVVSPITRREIAEVAQGAGGAVMLGAYTPTEAQTAHEAGADFVKLFPADQLGPSHVRALRAPMPHLRIVPTGGVSLETIGPFLAAGCAALGVGSSLVTSGILEKEDWGTLASRAKAFVERVSQVTGT